MYVFYIRRSSDLASTIKMSYIWPILIITCLALLLCTGVCMYIHLSYAEVVSETVVPPPSGVGQCYPSGLAST